MITVARISKTVYLTGTNFNAIYEYDLSSHKVSKFLLMKELSSNYRNIAAVGTILIIEDNNRVDTCTTDGEILNEEPLLVL